MSKSLEQLLQTVKNPVDLLRNSKIGAYVYPVVPSEFTNWRDEQKAWRDSAVLFDQSHHMAELLVTGPDALKMLNYLASNTFKGFVTDKAKQFAPISPSPPSGTKRRRGLEADGTIEGSNSDIAEPDSRCQSHLARGTLQTPSSGTGNSLGNSLKRQSASPAKRGQKC